TPASCMASISSALGPPGCGGGVVWVLCWISAAADCGAFPLQAANRPPSTGTPTPTEAPFKKPRRVMPSVCRGAMVIVPFMSGQHMFFGYLLDMIAAHAYFVRKGTTTSGCGSITV